MTEAVTNKLLESLPHTAKFVHLRVHSAYSLLEGALKVSNIANACLRFDVPALGITDRNNLFGALEIAENLSGKGVQPIIGVTLALTETPGVHDLPGQDPLSLDMLPHIALFVQNETGYENLMALVSAAHLEDQDNGGSGVAFELIKRHHDGLICLTGGPEGPVNRLIGADKQEAAEGLLSVFHEIFGDRLYVELQRYNRNMDGPVEERLIDLAYAQNIPLVATNQCFFESEADFEAHDALLCIADGTYTVEQNRRRLTPEHRLKSPREMVSLFADLPEAVENTVEIARRCAFRPEVRAPILPPFEGGDEQGELRRQAEEGLALRLQENEPSAPLEAYKQRLEFELDVIKNMGFPGYFLIVSDFIKWSKEHGVAVGPGRGSGAGSLVAWALTITDLDPLKFNLLFERFLNPERVSMPDFDIDFCQTRRDEVIRYVQEKYGHDQVAQIITFGKLQARAVLRDVGRVLQMPYGQVDRLCKMVPNNPANPTTLQEAIDGEPRLQEERDREPQVAQLIEIALKLEGLYRHASTHAAGVVIGDRPLQELVALYRDPKSDMPVTQFNMKWVEEAGLVKFDFLGLKTLTVLEKTAELLAAKGIDINVNSLPLDDEKTYELLGKGDTVGVFQLESAGMRDVLRKMRPDCFEDIIALVALYRPGPMDNIPKYIACKKGEQEPDYMHEMLQPVLEETYGVPVYQEQVMQIAQVMSGYSLGEADLLRRAMGKKKQEEMDRQKSRFIEGAMENGVTDKAASKIFDQVDAFAGYGFNKSHAAAYALIAYQTAYLKANYPVAFLAASMSLDFHNTDKLQVFVQDAQAHEIEVCIPDVNKSGVLFEIDDNKIFYALAAIKNVGMQGVADIIDLRNQGGPFSDIFDFAKRTGETGLNRRMLENMVAAGCFDSFEPDRARLYSGVDLILTEANLAAEEKRTKQDNLFGDVDMTQSVQLPAAMAWAPVDRLTYEFNAIGFYLSGHPMDDYKTALRRANVKQYADLQASVEKEVLIAGTLSRVDERKAKSGKPFAYLGLSDPTGQFEIIVFSETLERSRELLTVGTSVVISAKISYRDDVMDLMAEAIRPVDKVVANSAAGLRVFVEKSETLPNIQAQLSNAGTKPGQGGNVSLIFQNDLHEIEMRLPGSYAVTPRVSGAIKALSGVLHVEDL
ncbi:MAG: DNA polymerase III subunit alpha [Parvibaculales bacterium]